MIDRTKLEVVEREIKANLSVPDMYNKVLGFYGNLERESVCCPFHGEKTPSFAYSANLGIWTCFGECSKSGDTVELYRFYLEKHQGMKVSRTRTIQLLMELPEVNRYLSVDSLEMGRTNESFEQYLGSMMERQGRKLDGVKALQLSQIVKIRSSDSEENYKKNYNDLLYMRLKDLEVGQ